MMQTTLCRTLPQSVTNTTPPAAAYVVLLSVTVLCLPEPNAQPVAVEPPLALAPQHQQILEEALEKLAQPLAQQMGLLPKPYQCKWWPGAGWG